MNPDLAKLWQNVVTASTNAKAAGDTLTPDDMDQYLKTASAGKYGLKDITNISAGNIGRAALQGATMNWADELAGGKADPAELSSIRNNKTVQMLGDAALPGAGPLAAYGLSKARELTGWISDKLGGSPQVEQDMRLKGSLFHDAHPVVDDIAGVAGALAPSLLIPGGAEVGAGRAIARGAVTGAGAGVLAGAGAGTDAASRASGALRGGVLGAGLGALIPGSVAAYREIQDPAKRATDYITRAIGQGGGDDAIQSKIADFGITGKSDLPVLADMNPQLRALADMAATRSPNAKAMIQPIAAARQQGMSGRVLDDMVKHTTDVSGGVPADATSTLADMADRRNDWASSSEGYGGLRDANPTVPNTVFPKEVSQSDIDNLAGLRALVDKGGVGGMGGTASPAVEKMIDDLTGKIGGNLNPVEQQFLDILSKPKVNSALKDAQNTGLIKAMPSPTDAPTLDKLIQVKNKIAGLASTAYNKGDGPLGSALTEASNQVKQHLVDNVQGYSEVAQKYQQMMDVEQSVVDGKTAWNSDDNTGLKAMVSQMSPEQLFSFRYGMASELASKLRNAASSSDVAHRILDYGLAKDEKLATLFDNQATFNSFMKHTQLEADMAQLRGTYTGAATGYRTAAMQADPSDMMVSQAQHGLSGLSPQFLKGAVMRAAATMARGSMRTTTADAMAPMLMTKGTPAIDALLQSFKTQSPVMGAGGAALPSALSGATSRMGMQP